MANVIVRSKPAQQRKMTNAQREGWVALGFLTPNLLGFLLLSLGPIIFSLIISLLMVASSRFP